MKKESFSGSDEYLIDSKKCFSCGRCDKGCHFDAISMDGPANDIVQITYQIDPLACEGCGLCQLICPAEAIENKPAETGAFFISSVNEEQIMVHAKLGVGGENSGKLVSHVRMKSSEIAEETGSCVIVGDGPPGVSCPVIASVTGADLILIVTEPTVSGVHDLRRILELIHHFGLMSMIVINKADLNRGICKEIEETALEYNSKVIEKIPFDRNIHYALMEGKTILEYGKGPSVEKMESIALKIREE
jgi:MinD superfamily P-loop ATPase